MNTYTGTVERNVMCVRPDQGVSVTLGNAPNAAFRSSFAFNVRRSFSQESFAIDECPAPGTPGTARGHGGGGGSAAGSERAAGGGHHAVTVGVVIAVLFLLVIVIVTVAWAVYAYHNPNSKSGQWMIEVREATSLNLYYNSPYGLCPSPLSVALIFGLYRPSSGPIALRNV